MWSIKVKSQKSKVKSRGVSILFAVLIVSVILTIGTGISLISTQQTKMLGEIGYSTIAFYAADNGIEQVLLMSTPTNIPETQLPNGAKYEVIVQTKGGSCDAQNYCIKSVGTYQETRRAIEIDY